MTKIQDNALVSKVSMSGLKIPYQLHGTIILDTTRLILVILESFGRTKDYPSINTVKTLNKQMFSSTPIAQLIL